MDDLSSLLQFHSSLFISLCKNLEFVQNHNRDKIHTHMLLIILPIWIRPYSLRGESTSLEEPDVQAESPAWRLFYILYLIFFCRVYLLRLPIFSVISGLLKHF